MVREPRAQFRALGIRDWRRRLIMEHAVKQPVGHLEALTPFETDP